MANSYPFDPRNRIIDEILPCYNRDTKDVYIAVLGRSGAGKSSLINLASGSELGVNAGLESCTKEVQMSKPFEMENRRVWLIDTPGFDDSFKSDADILYELANFLAAQYKAGRHLHGVLYLHRISDVRMGEISKRNFDMFRKLCGTDFFPNVVLVSTMWSMTPTPAEIARERELGSKDTFFKPVLDAGGRFVRHYGTKESAHAALALIIHLNPRPLLIQMEMHQGLAVTDTSAAMELRKDITEAVKQHEEQIRALMEEFETSQDENEDFTEEMKSQELQELHQKIKELKEESGKLSEIKYSSTTDHTNPSGGQRLSESLQVDESFTEDIETIGGRSKTTPEDRMQGSGISVREGEERLQRSVEPNIPSGAVEFAHSYPHRSIPEPYRAMLTVQPASLSWKGIGEDGNGGATGPIEDILVEESYLSMPPPIPDDPKEYSNLSRRPSMDRWNLKVEEQMVSTPDLTPWQTASIEQLPSNDDYAPRTILSECTINNDTNPPKIRIRIRNDTWSILADSERDKLVSVPTGRSEEARGSNGRQPHEHWRTACSHDRYVREIQNDLSRQAAKVTQLEEMFRHRVENLNIQDPIARTSSTF